MQPPPDHPLPEFGGRPLHGPRERTKPPLIRPPHRWHASLVPHALAVEQLADPCLAEGPIPLRGDNAFAIERRRTLCRRGSLRAPCANPAPARLKVAELGLRPHWATDLGLAEGAPGPRDGERHRGAVPLHMDDTVVYQTPAARLPITVGRARGRPQGGESRGHGREPRPLLRLYVRGCSLEEAVVRFLALSCGPQGLLPPRLHRSCDPAIRRVDGLITPFRPVHLRACALHLLLPLPPRLRPFALDVLPGLETQRSGGRLQGSAPRARHAASEPGRLAPRTGRLGRLPDVPPTMIRRLVDPPSGHGPPAATHAADQAPGQPGDACAGRAHGVRARLLRLAPLVVLQVWRPGARGREMVLEQHGPLGHGDPPPSASAGARRGPRERDGAPAVGRGPGRDRLVADLTEGRSRRPPPVPRPRLRATPGAPRQPAMVAYEGVQQARARAHGLARLAEPLAHRPCLRIGIAGNLARGQEPRAHRNPMAQGTALGFVQAPPLQPLPHGLDLDCAPGTGSA
jgi:hypothetical protein